MEWRTRDDTEPRASRGKGGYCLTSLTIRPSYPPSLGSLVSHSDGHSCPYGPRGGWDGITLVAVWSGIPARISRHRWFRSLLIPAGRHDRGRARHDKETDMKTGPTSVSMSYRPAPCLSRHAVGTVGGLVSLLRRSPSALPTA